MPWTRARALVLVLLFPLVGLAAPTSELPSLERYLLDDADGVLVVNGRLLIPSSLFVKHFKASVEKLLASPAARQYLADTDVDPLNDIDRVVVVSSRSCYRVKPGDRACDVPLVLIQGRFDPEKLEAKLVELAKARPRAVRRHVVGKGACYHLASFGPRGLFVAILDNHTVAFASRLEHVAELQAKAAGTRVTRLMMTALPPLLKTFVPGVAIQGVGLETMIVSRTEQTTPGGMGTEVKRIQQQTLGQSGYRRVGAQVLVRDEARGTLDVVPKQKARTEELRRNLVTGLVLARVFLEQDVKDDALLAPLKKPIESARVTRVGAGIRVEGQAGPESIRAVLHYFVGRLP